MLKLLRSQVLLLQMEREHISVHVKKHLVRQPFQRIASFTTGCVHPKNKNWIFIKSIINIVRIKKNSPSTILVKTQLTFS